LPLLFQIDEDVQRHNELLEVVKSTPSDELGSIVAKRRKDFTVEFFNHLYYVAESYHDEPEKQTGEAFEYWSMMYVTLYVVPPFFAILSPPLPGTQKNI